jgi:hypothetical protein
VFQREACTSALDDLFEKLHAAQLDCQPEFAVWEGVEARSLLVWVKPLCAQVLTNLKKELQSPHVVFQYDRYANQLALSESHDQGSNILRSVYAQASISCGLVRLFTFIDTCPTLSIVNWSSTMWL